MTVRQKLNLNQKMEARLTMNQKLSLMRTLRAYRQEVMDDFVRYDTAIKAATDEIKRTGDAGTQILGALAGIVDQSNFTGDIDKNRGALLLEGDKGIRKLCAEIFARKLKSDHPLEVSEGRIEMALREPQEIESRLEQTRKLIEDMTRQGAEIEIGLHKELSENAELKSIIDSNKDFFEVLVQVMKIFLEYPLPQKNPIQQALVETYILDQCAFVVSERMAKQFADLFNPPLRSAEGMAIGFGNIMARYALVGMGIIEPEIFMTLKGELDKKIVEAEENPLFDNKKEIKALLARYDLKPGKYFYSRYALKGAPPSGKADDLIREFMTKIVRADAINLAQECGLDEFIGEFQSQTQSYSKAEKKDWIVEQGPSFLENARVTEKLKECIKKWFPALIKLLGLTKIEK